MTNATRRDDPGEIRARRYECVTRAVRTNPSPPEEFGASEWRSSPVLWCTQAWIMHGSALRRPQRGGSQARRPPRSEIAGRADRVVVVQRLHDRHSRARRASKGSTARSAGGSHVRGRCQDGSRASRRANRCAAPVFQNMRARRRFSLGRQGSLRPDLEVGREVVGTKASIVLGMLRREVGDLVPGGLEPVDLVEHDSF